MRLYTGIDWSEKKHDVVFMNEQGAAIARGTIPHTADGFLQLDRMRTSLGVAPRECMVALETAHNVLIDFLWSRRYEQVYVIPPSMTKSNRGRFGASRARTDQSDALLLAEILRTDRSRLYPWHPDTLLTRQIRAKVSLHTYLTRQVVSMSNRMRAVLLRYYPAAPEMFSSLQTQVALSFIQSYSTPQAAADLTFDTLQAFAEQHSYGRTAKLREYFARLQGPHPQATAETVQVYQDEAVRLATLLLDLIRAKLVAKREMKRLFDQHPDAFIFDSLPGAGEILAPSLLTKFGDDRARFPSADSVQALAGTCPVTDSSGKRKVVRFRRACDREFRKVAQNWAVASLPESVWANAYWHQVRPRCRTKSHAYRCLANRWLSIAWAIWQKRERYDETYHLQQRAKHSRKH
jgi:transposase